MSGAPLINPQKYLLSRDLQTEQYALRFK